MSRRKNPEELSSFELATDHFLALVLELKKKTPGPLLVGIGGPTACGKSQLTRMFKEGLQSRGENACILEGDRFLVPVSRRKQGAVFPEDVYELNRLQECVESLRTRQTIRVPFYEKDGRETGRIANPEAEIQPDIVKSCNRRKAKPNSRLEMDSDTSDVMEAIEPGDELWILDSELALLFPGLRALFTLTYGIRTSRERRLRNFLGAVARGERYPLLSEKEARRKIEGFWKTDDEIIEPTVDYADHQVSIR